MLAAILAVGLALVARGGDEQDSEPDMSESESRKVPNGQTLANRPSESLSDDPCEVSLEIAPDDAPELSREDAQTRALLGCEMEFAPGTVDDALAEAYAELCESADH